jgi:P pilus assembly chaperone PapD
MIHRSPLIALYAAVVLHGCSTAALNATQIRIRPSDGVVNIENRSPLATRIYLRTGATSIALGVVPGLATRQFTVPRGSLAASTTVQLEALERGTSSSFRSDFFSLNAERTAWWTVDRQRTIELIVK